MSAYDPELVEAVARSICNDDNHNTIYDELPEGYDLSLETDKCHYRWIARGVISLVQGWGIETDVDPCNPFREEA